MNRNNIKESANAALKQLADLEKVEHYLTTGGKLPMKLEVLFADLYYNDLKEEITKAVRMKVLRMKHTLIKNLTDYENKVS